jgi:hypothetical protein
MMLMNPKKTATLIISKLNKPYDGKEPMNEAEGPEQDYSYGLEACAEDMLKAIESKNVKALVEVMKQFHGLIDEMREMEEPGEEEMEEKGE